MGIRVPKRFGLLKELCETSGVSGREERVRKIVRREMDPLTDSIEGDALGNIYCTRVGTGEGPRVLLAGHLDEIGFVVHHIDDNGFVRMTPRGGFDPKTLVSQRVRFYPGGCRSDLLGIIGSKAIHVMTDAERNKPVTLGELFVDTGLPAEEVKARLKVGTPVTLYQPMLRVGELLSAKSLDNRISLYAMIEAFRRLDGALPSTVCAVGTAQEEVGLRGAAAAPHKFPPDIAVAIDVTLACDTPGVGADKYITRLGAGAAITVQDGASIGHPGLVRFMEQIAREEDIPYQLQILPRGGTDAGALQRAAGPVATVTLSLPLRYMHSVVECIHPADLDALVDLLTAFLGRAHELDLELR